MLLARPAVYQRVTPTLPAARGRTLESPVDGFAIALTRRPLFFAVVHLHTGEVLAVPGQLVGDAAGAPSPPRCSEARADGQRWRVGRAAHGRLLEMRNRVMTTSLRIVELPATAMAHERPWERG